MSPPLYSSHTYRRGAEQSGAVHTHIHTHTCEATEREGEVTHIMGADGSATKIQRDGERKGWRDEGWRERKTRCKNGGFP